MRDRWAVLLGIFGVMALSNAVVPVLPAFSDRVSFQGAIYAAYFLGALITVLPAGVASDRIGRGILIRGGLVLTVASGAVILLYPQGIALLAGRLLEGIAAGLFVAAGLSWVNSRADHVRLSGYFFASLNLGLLAGLLVAGALSALASTALGGIAFFTAFSLIPLLLSGGISEGDRRGFRVPNILRLGQRYLWLYLSAVVLLGVTGAIPAIYPQFSGGDPALLGLELATMNMATIAAVLVAPRWQLAPIRTIRIAAIGMAIAVMGSFVTPLAFPVIGLCAGFAIVSQMAFLAESGIAQGVLMGLYSAANYAGFAILPFIAAQVAENVSFLAAFAVVAAMTAMMALTIGRCECG
ncbi:MAG: MFS transporter [Methanomicrobiales archaeon]|nr:MFS transporter [Methanomicrobiales archaeon]MDI6877135.1 MFS transporter [Methanomicrobiales archaeon]